MLDIDPVLAASHVQHFDVRALIQQALELCG
jgi:hypothetical protein